MVTFRELRDGEPARLSAAEEAWAVLSREMRRLESRVVADVIRTLRRSGWSGEAARAAFQVIDSLDDEFELAARQVGHAMSVIGHARVKFVEVRQSLLDMIDRARAEGMRVDETGIVHPPQLSGAARADPAAQQAQQRLVESADNHSGLLAATVDRATRLDRECSRVLRLFAPDRPGRMEVGEWSDAWRDAGEALKLLGLPEIRSGMSIAEARDWWQKLTPEQQSLYLAAYPGQLGALNGLPTVDRHTANMMNLRIALSEAQNTVTVPTLSQEAGIVPPTQRLTTLLDRLEAAEHGPEARRLYLLRIDNRGDGLGIVSVGNPDTTRYTTVMVPGVENTLDHMGALIDRADSLQMTADAFTADAHADVAVIAWLGYDTPGVLNSPSPATAAQAAPVLRDFIDAVRVGQPEGAELRVIGHSYGSVVVGMAASQGDGLRVNDGLVVGSPGMRVDRADQLRMLPGGRLWVGAAPDDLVAHSGVHGPQPHLPAFGASRFHVDTTGHSGYWQPDSMSLRSQAWFVLGRHGNMVPHFSPTLEDLPSQSQSLSGR